jgi:altronate dehydratase small subunit
MESKRALVLNSKDNVAVAVENIEAGDLVRVEVRGDTPRSIRAGEAIPLGFKLALTDIPRRGYVVKHGEVIGRATSEIGMGTQVHVHNVEGVRAQSTDRKGEGR